jgi:hypothetical protein
MKRAHTLRSVAVIAAATCMLLVILLATSHAATTPVTRTAPLETSTATPTATVMPTCEHSTAMAIALSDPAPELGQRITATVSLTNTGDCMVGLPLYTLDVANAHPVAVFEESENPVLHSRAIYSDEVDSVDFRMLVANTEVFTLTARASFEVHVGYPGPAFWGGASAAPVTFTVPSTDTGMVIMTQAAYDAGCLTDIAFIEDTLTLSSGHFSCALAAGHSVTTYLSSYADADAAHAAFMARAEGHDIVPYADCRPSFSTVEDGLGPIVVHRQVWVGEQWLVSCMSQDDTSAMGGDTGVRSVYRALRANDLLAPCRHFYLPSIKTK